MDPERHLNSKTSRKISGYSSSNFILQLLLLGSLSSTRVSYGERAQIAFKHLYLYEWDPQYETLPYPPSSGAYAFYSREEFYEAVGFVMRQVSECLQ